MINTSSEFTTAASATVRKPRARVTITWADPYIDNGTEATANDQARVDYIDQVADLRYQNTRKWLHLDESTPIGEMSAMPSSDNYQLYQIGWWGATESLASGEFALPYPELTLTLPKARYVPAVRVSGDQATGEYPVDFTLELYRGVTLAATVSTTDNDSVLYDLDLSSYNLADITKIIITITKWSAGNRVVKLTELYSSIAVVYDGDDIIDMQILEESEVSGGSIPVGNMSANEIRLKLQNADDTFFPGNTDSSLSTQVKSNRKIISEIGFELSDGSIEYVPMGVYWTDDWDTPEQAVYAATTGRDRMSQFKDLIYSKSEVWQDITLYDLLDNVLTQAAIDIPDLRYYIDTELQDTTVPVAWFDRVSYAECLQKIMVASMGRAFFDRNGILQVQGPSAVYGGASGDNYQISQDDYFDKRLPAKTEELRNTVSAEVRRYEISDEVPQPTVYESSEEFEIQAGVTKTVTIEFSEFPVLTPTASIVQPGTDLAPVHAEISSVSYYSWGAVLEIDTDTTESVSIKAVGSPVTEESVRTVSKSDSSSITEYGQREYKLPENQLVQTQAQADTITDTLLDAYSGVRRDISLDWRGNPALELTDGIRAPEYKKGGIDTQQDYKIIRQSIRLDSGLRVRTEARLISTTETEFQDTDGASTAWQDADFTETKYQG